MTPSPQKLTLYRKRFINDYRRYGICFDLTIRRYCLLQARTTRHELHYTMRTTRIATDLEIVYFNLLNELKLIAV